MAETLTPPEETRGPVSLRDENTPPPAQPASDPRQIILLALTALLFLLVGLVAASFFGGDDGIDEEELQAVVEEAVGTQVAALAPASNDAMPGDVEQMIEDSVGTQVAALRPTNTPIPPTPTIIPAADYQQDDAFLGPADAPVVIVEFSDFQCGFCGRWFNTTLPEILEKYPDQVKFVYRDFPIFGEDSVRAAMATECAEEQDKFWELHDAIFTVMTGEEPVELSQDTLVSMAGDLDMDTDAFTMCLDSQRYAEEVQADYQDAVRWGLQGTPGYVINGVVYPIGAQTFDVFDQIIQQQLAQS